MLMRAGGQVPEGGDPPAPPGRFEASPKYQAAPRLAASMPPLASASHFPELRFGLTGLPVLESDEMAAAQHDTRLASWLAVAPMNTGYALTASTAISEAREGT